MRGDVAELTRRLRFPILFLFFVAALGALHFVPPARPVALLLAAIGGFAVALVLLRNWELALAAVLAPFPGILWSSVSSYALCIAVGILMAAGCQSALLKGQNPLAAMGNILGALLGTLLFALLWSLHAPTQLSSLLAGSASTVIFLPGLVLAANFGEEAVAEGNRQRETLLRIFAFAGRLSEPRWSFSLAGAGLVLAVLGYFKIPVRPQAFEWLSCLAIALIVWAWARDGRMSLAALAISALLLLFAGGVGGVQLLFLLLVLVLARDVSAWRVAGEGVSSAFLRAIEERGPALLCGGGAAMIAALPRGGLPAGLRAGYALIGALILFPALAGVLHALAPQRRSMEEAYRAETS